MAPRLEGLALGIFTVRGINEVGKRQIVEDWMQRAGMDLLLLQETKVNRARTENRGACEWYFNTGVGAGAAAEAAALRADGWRVPPPTARRSVEHLGVGIVCRGWMRELLTDVRPKGARLMEATFSTQPPLRVGTHVAPHAG